jgi:hypothetical protein
LLSQIHRVPAAYTEGVSAAAADAMCACVDRCPPGATFPSRGCIDAPRFTTLHVGRLGSPLVGLYKLNPVESS